MRDEYLRDLKKREANYQPLTPLTFLERAAEVYADQPAILHGSRTWSYGELYSRSRRLASSLSRHGIQAGDTVSVILANTPAMLEAHYGVPMSGGVLHSVNTRLDASAIAQQLDHAESKVLIVDREFSHVARAALEQASVKPLIVDYDDTEHQDLGPAISDLNYEDLISTGDPDFAWIMPGDEWSPITLNYTSGSTGNPKGVVYHHRGAALMCYSNVLAVGMGKSAVYLWTLPMFHCNGWCFPWTLSLVGGVHVCLRWVRGQAMRDLIRQHGVTHMCGAPVVMSELLNASSEELSGLGTNVCFAHAAAPPPQVVLDKVVAAGFRPVHLYGLTETYGPATLNEWRAEWDRLDPEVQSRLRVRQGVKYAGLEKIAVLDPATMKPVPKDGETLGEVMFRGNIVMMGYLKNKKATDEAFSGEWFHSGDLAVWYPDGYVQLKDRSKDIIISGGENISSVDVEDVIYKHPAVASCAVVAKPDEKWGETPCAFVELKPGAQVAEAEIISWCRDHLAHFKCPRAVIFAELPRTSTGKIQKFVLREIARGTSA